MKLFVAGLAVVAIGVAGCSSSDSSARNDAVPDGKPSSKNIINQVGTVDEAIANDARGIAPYPAAGDDVFLVGQYVERGGYDKGAVYLMNEDGEKKQIASGFSPGAFAVDGKDVYMTIPNQQTVNKLDVSTGKVTQILPEPGPNPAKAVKGCPDKAAGKDLGFNWPWGLAIDDDRLYIADINNNCIRSVDLGDKKLTVKREVGLASGAGGFNGTGQEPTNTQLHAPGGIDFDSQGDLFIADTLNQIIWELDVKKKSSIKLVAGVPQKAGFNGDGQKDTQTFFNYPMGVLVDKQNEIFVADSRNNRVRVIQNNKVYTLAGTGVWGNSGNGGAAQDAELAGPWDLAVLADDNVNKKFANPLFFTDSGNHAVRVITNRDDVEQNPPASDSSLGETGGGSADAAPWPPAG